MHLYLVQHGLAQPKETHPDRPLTEQGERDLRQMAAFLQNYGVRVKECFHSGKTRALQSAQILAESLSDNPQACEMAGIGPNDPVIPISREFNAWVSDRVIVGHMPFMARLADHLLTEGPHHKVTDFEPGTVICLLRQEGGNWLLEWALRPSLLAGLTPG